jgi:alpha-methylacyl-CoA racemase
VGGPLEGVRVVEFAGLGPGPFCGMLLADLGADVVRIDRRGARGGLLGALGATTLLDRGKRSIALDLKDADDLRVVHELVRRADVLLEGFRPGVMERLGLGPDDLLAQNPALVYGRMTGWGQEGPYAATAGHDINYIALSGALDPVGRKGEGPVPPLNMIGDFGGGAMLLALGICAALLETGRSGQGQVIDASMVDGSALLTTMFHSFIAMGVWEDARGSNMLDSGAHFYDAYETADGKYISVGSIEAQFYAELLKHTGLDGEDLPWQHDRAQWPALKERLAAIFKQKTRDEWCEIMEGTDVCFAPVLSLTEAPEHPHNQHRGTFVEVAGIVQPGPAPRFSRTPGEVRSPPPHAGQHTDDVLADWGVSRDRIAELRSSGAIA